MHAHHQKVTYFDHADKLDLAESLASTDMHFELQEQALQVKGGSETGMYPAKHLLEDSKLIVEVYASETTEGQPDMHALALPTVQVGATSSGSIDFKHGKSCGSALTTGRCKTCWLISCAYCLHFLVAG